MCRNLIFPLAFFSICAFCPFEVAAQCPEIISSSLLSPDCHNGSTPCDLCPGESLTLSVSGEGLPHQGCINWYYSTTPGFNPYNGEGILMGCATIDAPPPAPCSTCPEILLIWIDACGAEAPNEFMIVGSGSGFNVNNFGVDFDVANNNMPPLNDDINTGGGACNWQVPTPGILATVEGSAGCNSGNVFAAGPGTQVPPDALVIIFTSSAATTQYNFEQYCADGRDIYVMQNSCARTVGAFSNLTSQGLRTTTIVMNNCNCSHSLTHDTDDPALLGDGDYAYYNNGSVEYGNSGCNNPTPPFVEPGEVVFPPSNVADFQFTATAMLCNGGPYYVTGIVSPLGANCNQVFTDEFSFNVVCPEAIASVNGAGCVGGSVMLHASGGDLYQWSGPGGFNSNEQNPTISPLTPASAGTYTVTVTNAAGCTDVAQVSLTLFPEVTVSIHPAMPAFCAGQNAIVTATGQGGGGNFQFEWNTPNGVGYGPSVEISQAGVFSVTLTDANGCTASADGGATLDEGPEVSVFPDPAIFCEGDSLELTAIVVGGAGGNEYLWVDPWGNVFLETTLWAKTAGLYSVEVTDQNGCVGTSSVNLDVRPLPDVSIGANPPQICDGTSSTLTASGSGGTGNYTFVWTTPSGASGDNPLVTSETGLYMVTLTDEAGCMAIDSLTLANAPPLAVSFSPANPSFCAGGSVTLAVQVQGHQGNPLTYSWDTPGGPFSGTPLITGTPGTYTVTVSEENGCTGTASVDVTETSGLTITLTPATLELCPGGSVWVRGEANGGDGDYEYVWLFDGGPIFGDSLLIHSTGVYYFGAVDGNNCEGMDSIIVVEATPMDVSIVSSTSSLCPGDQAILTLDPAPQQGWQVSWDTPSGPVNSYPLTATLPGVYRVEVNIGGGCVSVDSFLLAASPAPVVEISPVNPSFCTGGSVLLTANVSSGGPGVTYAWTTPSGPSGNASLTATLAGNYAVTVTNADGCTGVTSTTVSVASGLSISFANTSITICSGGEAALTPLVQGGAEPYAYQWNGPDGPASGSPLLTSTPGNYQVTVTDANGCSGIASVQVLIGASLLVEIDPTAPGFCPGETVELTANSPGGQAPLSLEWNTPSGNWTTPNGIAATAGTFSVTITDASGCSGSASVLVTAWESPQLLVEPAITQVCAGQTVDLIASATGSPGPYQFAWNGPNGLLNGSAYPNGTAGTYGVTVTDSRGCQSESTFTIQAGTNLQVSIAASSTTVCGGDAVTLTATAIGGQTPFSFMWNAPQGSSSMAQIEVASAGWVFVEVTDANGCSGRDSMEIHTGELDVVLLSIPERCPGAADGSITIEGIGQGTMPLLVRVNSGVTQAVSQLPFIIDGLATGFYTIDIADAGSCEVQEIIQVDVLYTPQVVFPQPEITILRGESTLLAPDFQFDPTEFIWSPTEGLSCTACPNPLASPVENTTYMVTAFDEGGCEASASIRILTVGNTRIYVPTAISPNFDGINDVFYIHAADGNVRIAELQIFDRWGNQLFQAQDIPVNDAAYGWDGSYRGKRMEPGVYIYTAQIVFPDGFVRLYRGDITLVY